METTKTHADEVLREGQAANYLGVSRRWMQDRRIDGNGPPFIRLTARSIRYKRNDLDTWLENHRHQSTAEYV
jgi:excisionase family DNA binding protein